MPDQYRHGDESSNEEDNLQRRIAQLAVRDSRELKKISDYPCFSCTKACIATGIIISLISITLAIFAKSFETNVILKGHQELMEEWEM